MSGARHVRFADAYTRALLSPHKKHLNTGKRTERKLSSLGIRGQWFSAFSIAEVLILFHRYYVCVNVCSSDDLSVVWELRPLMTAMVMQMGSQG